MRMLSWRACACLPSGACGKQPVSKMSDEKGIYNQNADRYEQLVAREDYQRNILPALQSLCLLEGTNVVELGAGTARLTRLLAPFVRSILALDASPHMLGKAVKLLRLGGWRNWQAAIADHRRLPARSRSADLVISGWSICYLVVWGGENWRLGLAQCLSEMERLLRPGGTIILLETLGTGCELPKPPDSLKEYYAFLEETGFASTWIRTDYKFQSLAEAQRLAGFFFGDEMARQVAAKNWVILPECTGLWWKKAC